MNIRPNFRSFLAPLVALLGMSRPTSQHIPASAIPALDAPVIQGRRSGWGDGHKGQKSKEQKRRNRRREIAQASRTRNYRQAKGLSV